MLMSLSTFKLPVDNGQDLREAGRPTFGENSKVVISSPITSPAVGFNPQNVGFRLAQNAPVVIVRAVHANTTFSKEEAWNPYPTRVGIPEGLSPQMEKVNELDRDGHLDAAQHGVVLESVGGFNQRNGGSK